MSECTRRVTFEGVLVDDEQVVHLDVGVGGRVLGDGRGRGAAGAGGGGGGGGAHAHRLSTRAAVAPLQLVHAHRYHAKRLQCVLHRLTKH